MTPPPPNPMDPIRSDRRLRDSRREGEDLVALAVARAKEGDRSALQFLYIRYAGEVHRYVNSIVGDHYEAEDITQGVFLKLMRVLGSYRQRDVPFAAWLRRVARNAALENLRSKRAVPFHELQTGEESREEFRSERVRGPDTPAPGRAQPGRGRQGARQDGGRGPRAAPPSPNHVQGHPARTGGDAADEAVAVEQIEISYRAAR
jgi:RNA polymerase sigma factor (sigma-70 family)